MEKEVTMIIKVPADQLTNFRLFTVTRGGAVVDVRTEEGRSEHLTFKTKEEYVELYENRKDFLNDIFDETATAEEVAGFFIYHEGDDALNKLLEYLNGEEGDNVEKEAVRILKTLYGQER